MHGSAQLLLVIDFWFGSLRVLLLILYLPTGSDWAMALESVFRSCSICRLTAPVGTTVDVLIFGVFFRLRTTTSAAIGGASYCSLS